MFAGELVLGAWLGGTCIAVACGTLGWFVVVRGQVFAGDALGHVAFVGAIAAAAAGVDERVGLFAATLLAAGGLGLLGRRAQADDVTVGTAFAQILGIGVLLLAILATSPAGASGVTAANALFGSIYSLSAGAGAEAAAVALGATALVLGIARPLLLSTLDPELAALRGIRVRLLGIALLVALAALTAQGTPAVGALLLLGLIAAPAGAATLLTSRPYRGIALSAAIAVAATWGGLALSLQIGSLPPSSAIVALAAGAYVAAGAWSRLRPGS